MVDAQIDGDLRDGDFERAKSHFRDWVGVDPRSGAEGAFPAQAGRHHLYVASACPWCHRTAILRELAGLTDAVGVSYLAPFRDERGWAFSGEPFMVGAADSPERWGGVYVDRLHGWRFVSEGYRVSDAGFEGRVTVPALWDTRRGGLSATSPATSFA